MVVWSSPAEPSFYEPDVVFGINGMQYLVQRMMETRPGDDVDGIIYAAAMISRAAAA